MDDVPKVVNGAISDKRIFETSCIVCGDILVWTREYVYDSENVYWNATCCGKQYTITPVMYKVTIGEYENDD